MPQPAQSFHVSVVDVPVAEKWTQRFAVELRIMPGTGNGADVYDSQHTIGFQDLHKFFEGPGGMAHSENHGGRLSGLILFQAADTLLAMPKMNSFLF